jgi:uncharacterized protein (DUF2235 family)
MSKNIVLCSDGTGNKGGSTPDSNVFKIYNAIDINNKSNPTDQVTYYDNGVGTSKISLMQALGGGMGWGFKQNVIDLYEFLGRNYTEGDDIYIFGFSRGAATVRAFAGMIEHCGLVVKNLGSPDEIPESEFQQLIKEAMDAYADGAIKKGPDGRIVERDYVKADTFRDEHAYKHNTYAPNGKLKIEFMGIWDTVSSLGVPQLPPLDLLVNLAIPHKYYDLEPETSVNNVYHAIAVDDERRTFWPLVWDENSYRNDMDRKIEQVWFAGMHSNVGGGYNRQELATVTLDWMIEKLSCHKDSQPRNGGLNLKESAVKDAKVDANPFGKLHDSRSGFGIFYRYQPRPIEVLCRNRLNDAPIKIHNTVFQRMKYRTGEYIPQNIPTPDQFQEVHTRSKDSEKDPSNGINDNVKTQDYEIISKKINHFKKSRISLYWVFMISVILLVVASICKWTYPPYEEQLGLEPWRNIPNISWWLGHIDVRQMEFEQWNSASWTSSEWYLKHIADSLHYILPDIFSGTISYGVIENPIWFSGFIIYAAILFICRLFLQHNMERLQEKARLELLSLRELSKIRAS